MNPHQDGQSRCRRIRRPNVQQQRVVILRLDRRCKRAKYPTHRMLEGDRTIFSGVATLLPRFWLLRWAETQIIDRGGRVWNSFESENASLLDTVELAIRTHYEWRHAIQPCKI